MTRIIRLPAQEIPEKVLPIESVLVIPDQSRMIVNTGAALNENFERTLSGEELDSILDMVEPAVTAKVAMAKVEVAVEEPVEKAPLGDGEVAP